MKHAFAYLLLIASLFAFGYSARQLYNQIQQEKLAAAIPTEQRVRQAVVTLLGERESHFCSGVQVLAPSQKTYILTAAHCAGLSTNGIFAYRDEAGVVRPALMLKFDLASDIMLLSSGSGEGLPMAKTLALHEQVRIVGHGSGNVISGPFPTYSLYGEVLGIYKHSFYALRTCMTDGCPMISHWLTTTTVPVLAGSSGGALLNSKNEVVGIVSIYCPDNFSGHVPLAVLQTILNGK